MDLPNEEKLQMLSQCRNVVKKCTACGKPCATTLIECNSCGATLPTQRSFTDNIFFGFVYGANYKISVRHEDQNYLVFDDPLSLARCHLNIIPTKEYIADWRQLLDNPERGLKIIDDFLLLATTVLRDQFLSNKEFALKNFRELEENEDKLRALTTNDDKLNEFVQNNVLTGFNYPPSQFLLHLQFVVLPLIPFQYKMYLDGLHATQDRFFPLSYVREILCHAKYIATNDPDDSLQKMHLKELNGNSDVADITKFFSEQGISYETIYRKVYKNIEIAQERQGNWKKEDFGGVVNMETGEVLMKTGEESASDSAPVLSNLKKDAVILSDKNILQNYGRPYNEKQQPTGSYYKYPHRHKPLTVFK